MSKIEDELMMDIPRESKGEAEKVIREQLDGIMGNMAGTISDAEIPDAELKRIIKENPEELLGMLDEHQESMLRGNLNGDKKYASGVEEEVAGWKDRVKEGLKNLEELKKI